MTVSICVKNTASAAHGGVEGLGASAPTGHWFRVFHEGIFSSEENWGIADKGLETGAECEARHVELAPEAKRLLWRAPNERPTASHPS